MSSTDVGLARNRRLGIGALLTLSLLTGCDGTFPTVPEAASPGDILRLTIPAPGFTQVSTGREHACALRGDGVAECWGNNGSGQAPATKAATTGAFTQVSPGFTHTCAVRTDGIVECWGSNLNNQAPATKAAASGSFVQVSSGIFHTCALRSDGVVECWGSNILGRAPATKAAAEGAFTEVTAAQYHTCALRADGVVECWGDNDSGQAPATKTAATGSFTQVSAGVNHTCALRSDGVLECWGSDLLDQAPATKTAAVGVFAQVSSGILHTCALRDDGVIECWGYGTHGQSPATKTAASGSFTAVSGRGHYTCALRGDGVVECWGLNSDGQAPATKTSTGLATTVLPTATFNAPASVVAGESANLSLTNAQVLGYDGSPYTYAFDCGSGYGAFSDANTASCATTVAGSLNVRGTVKDRDGDAQEYTATVAVLAPPVSTIEDIIEGLLSAIDGLEAEGVLTENRARTLAHHLSQLIESLGRGNENAALSQLNGFRAQVENLVGAGDLTAEQGQTLLDLATQLADLIQGSDYLRSPVRR